MNRKMQEILNFDIVKMTCDVTELLHASLHVCDACSSY